MKTYTPTTKHTLKKFRSFNEQLVMRSTSIYIPFKGTDNIVLKSNYE